MRRILFLFLDGIGLGDDDPEVNPFAVAQMPTLLALTNEKRWLKGIERQENKLATFIPTDPRLGVEGRPQSGSSQAAILTGRNVPQMIGRHYGPKPNEPIRELLERENFFKEVRAAGYKAALLDAYPPKLIEDIERDYRLPSSIQYAAIHAGQLLFTKDDLLAGRALTAEWTGKPWRDHLGIDDIPVYEPYEAGHRLASIARGYTFAFHSHWMTDYVGHRGPFERGVALLEQFDAVMQGVLDVWDVKRDLIVVTSDHGNMEVIGDRHHTENDVPTLIIGKHRQRIAFADGLARLTDFVPQMRVFLGL